MTTDRDASSEIADVSRTWTKLGSEDPMWAVLREIGELRNQATRHQPDGSDLDVV